jgi:hypothetical protein
MYFSWNLQFIVGFSAEEVAPSNAVSYLANFSCLIYKLGEKPLNALVNTSKNDNLLHSTSIILLEQTGKGICSVELVRMALGCPWSVLPLCALCETLPGSITVWRHPSTSPYLYKISPLWQQAHHPLARLGQTYQGL